MAKAVDNPCNGICSFSGDVCIGCGRAKDEIRSWKSMKHPQKQATAKRAAQRLKKLRR